MTILELIKNHCAYLRVLGKFVIVCPFHREVTASGTYDDEEDSYRCISCGKCCNGEALAKAIIRDIEANS